MKSIELTEEHKTKLLEMCKVLFPEYDLIEFGKKYHPNNKFIWMSKNNNLKVDIHWFEFCMTHLQFKFKKLGIELDLWLLTLPTTHLQWGNYNFNHPVDYLYEEFKKLK